MKKIMMLGGARFLLPAIRAAHELGLYVITCDYLPDNPAHQFADEYHNISTTDKDALLEKARELQIDGIISFACDSGVVSAAYVAEQMGLPTMGPYESVCILQNKSLFRQFLTDNGFVVPVAKAYATVEEARKETELFRWPVIVKPVDSCGSKGVTRVETPEEVEDAFAYAKKFSLSGEVIVEEFIEKKGDSSDSDCFSVDGELKMVTFSGQRFDSEADNPYTPAGYSWPSEISPAAQDELTKEIARLLRLLNMKTALYNVETREGVDGRAYIMEVSPRAGGNRLSEMIRFATGVDMITNCVRAAVGMPVVDIEQRPYDGCWAELILHSDSAGVFDTLWIADEIADAVVEKDLWYESGDEVEGFSGANKMIGTLVMKFQDAETLKRVMDNPQQYVKVVLKR